MLGRARRIGSFKLFGDFVEPGLDARLVDAGRAGDADPGNNLVAQFNRQPAGNGDDVGQGYLLAHHRVVVGEALGMIGLKGIYVDSPDQVASAWEAALAADRPVVVEFKTDPEVPPLPPHITLKQAKAFVATLWKGDPEESGVIVGTARQVLSSILPGGSDKK